MAKAWRQITSPQPREWARGKRVGSGSHGKVHLAMNKATGGLFVVKSAQSEAARSCLEHEAKILESLNSPHVVQYMGRDLTKGTNGDNQINLFIEYMAGGSLSDIAEKFGGALDESVVRLYTKEILLGLKYLHENGVIHCDIKSKNVLLDSAGNVKLADFGCARRPKELGTNKPLIGTPLWTAPEVLRNEGLDFAADIWSLGCTVIEMATGSPPWDAKVSNPLAAVMKIATGNERPRFPLGFSKAGVDFLEKCLERDPKKRWKAEELLRHPFISGSLREEEEAFSPTSVLDVGMCEEDYESDESVDRWEFGGRIPFSKWRGNISLKHNQTENVFSSSENWITVR